MPNALARVQGNYSDLLVQLSNIYSQLRGDTSGQKNEDSAQGFVRSTTKYWVSQHALSHLSWCPRRVCRDFAQRSTWHIKEMSVCSAKPKAFCCFMSSSHVG